MAIFGKNKNVNVEPTFTITLDKSDASYKDYGLSKDRAKRCCYRNCYRNPAEAV